MPFYRPSHIQVSAISFSNAVRALSDAAVLVGPLRYVRASELLLRGIIRTLPGSAGRREQSLVQDGCCSIPATNVTVFDAILDSSTSQRCLGALVSEKGV